MTGQFCLILRKTGAYTLDGVTKYGVRGEMVKHMSIHLHKDKNIEDYKDVLRGIWMNHNHLLGMKREILFGNTLITYLNIKKNK